MRNGFVFYESFHTAISYLPPDDQLRMFHAIVAYGIHQQAPDLPTHLLPIWALIVPQIDANQERYLNGKKGGRKPVVSKPETSGYEPNNQWLETEKPKEKEKEKEKEKDKVKEKGMVIEFPDFKTELLADEMFCETFMMSKNCDRKELEKQVNDFETDLKLKDLEHSTFSKYKRHFANWVAYKNITQKPHWSHTITSEERFYFDEHGTLPDGTMPY